MTVTVTASGRRHAAGRPNDFYPKTKKNLHRTRSRTIITTHNNNAKCSPGVLNSTSRYWPSSAAAANVFFTHTILYRFTILAVASNQCYLVCRIINLCCPTNSLTDPIADGTARNRLDRALKTPTFMTTSQTPATVLDSISEAKSIDIAERRLPVTEYFKPLVEGDRLESTLPQQLIVLGSSLLISAMFYKTWMLCQVSPETVHWPGMVAAILLGYEFADFGYHNTTFIQRDSKRG